MFKRVKRAVQIHVLPPIVYLFLMLLRATLRIEHVNREQAQEAWNKNGNVIACFWHARLLLMPFAVRRTKAKVLISRHRDGEFIARVIRFFGLDTIRGSYKKGGVSSLREMLTAAKEGWTLAITPDGPKGPRYKIKEGLVEVAKLTQKPILPVTYGARKKKPLTHGTGSFCLTLFQRLSFSGESPSI